MFNGKLWLDLHGDQGGVVDRYGDWIEPNTRTWDRKFYDSETGYWDYEDDEESEDGVVCTDCQQCDGQGEYENREGMIVRCVLCWGTGKIKND